MTADQTVERRVTLVNRYGLHARPAMMFVDLAARYPCDVRMALGDREVDGKSIMGLMTLGAAKGAELRITAAGDEAGDALEALVDLVESGFSEEE